MLFEEVKYRNKKEFIESQDHLLTDYFLQLSDELKYLESKRQLKGVLSLYPQRSRKTEFEVLPFYTFSTNRTSYASLKLVEDVFANFYLQTDILPIVNPIHHSYIKNYKDLPRHLVRKFLDRGALLYAN